MIVTVPLISSDSAFSYNAQGLAADGAFFFSSDNNYHKTFDSAWGCRPSGLLWVPDITSSRYQRPAL